MSLSVCVCGRGGLYGTMGLLCRTTENSDEIGALGTKRLSDSSTLTPVDSQPREERRLKGEKRILLPQQYWRTALDLLLASRNSRRRRKRYRWRPRLLPWGLFLFMASYRNRSRPYTPQEVSVPGGVPVGVTVHYRRYQGP